MPRISTMIFDLDGTLVQTERLKAQSYARAAVELCPDAITEEDVIEAYKDVVGLSREEVATALMEQFSLEAASRDRMNEFDASEPWEAFVGVRMQYYDEMLADPAMIRDNRWPHALMLLEQARITQCHVALATTSRRDQAQRVLAALDLEDAFDVIATADDVEHTKPDPEIYHLVLDTLNTQPGQTLAIEDSPAGVEAATRAGVWCIAVTTDFTRDGIHEAGLLDKRWIVDDHSRLKETVQAMMNEAATAA